METMYQNFQLQNYNLVQQQQQQSNCHNHKSSSYWTREENKIFESALAIHDKNTTDRWEKVAQMIPWRSVLDVRNKYKELEDDVSFIEAGLVPSPGYSTSSFTLNLSNDQEFDELRKKTARSRSVDHDKKKGVPWTEDEHRRFLRGLMKHGKGDWRSISRNFVISKTPTQVASHAQKYFLRLNSELKDKRRPSIHDITTSNFKNGNPPSDDHVDAETKAPDSDWNPHVHSQNQNQNWNSSIVAFESRLSNVLASPGSYHGMRVGTYDPPMFEVHSTRLGILG